MQAVYLEVFSTRMTGETRKGGKLTTDAFTWGLLSKGKGHNPSGTLERLCTPLRSSHREEKCGAFIDNSLPSLGEDCSQGCDSPAHLASLHKQSMCCGQRTCSDTQRCRKQLAGQRTVCWKPEAVTVSAMVGRTCFKQRCVCMLSCIWLFVTPGPSCPWNLSGKNTRVGCHFLLQGIFTIQGSNLGLLNCRQILYHLSR